MISPDNSFVLARLFVRGYLSQISRGVLTSAIFTRRLPAYRSREFEFVAAKWESGIIADPCAQRRGEEFRYLSRSRARDIIPARC